MSTPVDPAITRRFIASLSMHLEDDLASWKSSILDAQREAEALLSSLTVVAGKIPAQARPLLPEDVIGLLLEDILPPPPKPERVVEKVVEKVVVPGPTVSADWTAVRSAFSAIESSRTQVDVLTRFLVEATSHASRVALLVLRNDRLTGWKALGFDSTGGRDEAVKALDLQPGDDALVAEVLKTERSMLAEPPSENSALRRALGGRPPSRSLLVPMVIRDRLAGILIGDELPADSARLNPAALEVLTFITGLTVDLLAARKKIPSPSLTPKGAEIARFATGEASAEMEPGATMRAPAVVSEPEHLSPQAGLRPQAFVPSPQGAPHSGLGPLGGRPGFEPAMENTGRTKKRITDAGEALRALEESASARRRTDGADLEFSPGAMRPGVLPVPGEHRAPEIRPAIDDARPPVRPAPIATAPGPTAPPITPAPVGELTMAFEQLKTGPGAPPPPAPRPANALREATGPRVSPLAPPSPASPSPPVADALAGGGATPLAPPAGFVPRSRSARGENPQKAIDDAKRLARLLISEIKLYNERKVDEGRAAGDLYQRLKDDILRSQQVYVERTPEAVRLGGDYFHEELVRILGDGRADALGPRD